jgi:murein endopeptidase
MRLDEERLQPLAVGFWIGLSVPDVAQTTGGNKLTGIAGAETALDSGVRLTTCMKANLEEMKGVQCTGDNRTENKPI